jgi:hypothetical protein
MATLLSCVPWPIGLKLPGDLLLHSWGCWSTPGTNGSPLRCHGQGGLCSSTDPSCDSLSRARLQICHPSNGSLGTTINCHRLHSIPLQCFSHIDHHIEHESDHPQLGIQDFYTASAQLAVVGPAFIYMFANCCSSHSAIA